MKKGFSILWQSSEQPGLEKLNTLSFNYNNICKYSWAYKQAGVDYGDCILTEKNRFAFVHFYLQDQGLNRAKACSSVY